jgi:hypothetical protein
MSNLQNLQPQGILAVRDDQPQEAALGPRSRFAGRRSRHVFLMAVMIAALLGMASPAGATVVWSSGATGYTTVSLGKCSYASVWRTLYTSAPPPTIYATNYRTGWGNDAQYVRYSVMLIDYDSGVTLQSTGYSGIAVAWDNSPAQFSGSTSFSARAPGNYRVLFNIEWLDDSGGTVLGRAYQRVDSYRYFEDRAGPFGPYRSCAHI